jgi:hypothetical protein
VRWITEAESGRHVLHTSESKGNETGAPVPPPCLAGEATAPRSTYRPGGPCLDDGVFAHGMNDPIAVRVVQHAPLPQQRSNAIRLPAGRPAADDPALPATASRRGARNSIAPASGNGT